MALLELATPAPAQFPPVTDIRQDLTRFDSVFGLPAARIEVDNSLARSATPWLAGGEEMQDTEIVHAIAPDATIREVLVNPDALATSASAITAFITALRQASSEADVISLSVSLGEHFFTKAEATSFHQAVELAQARHVTASATNGAYEGETAWNTLPSMPGGHSSASGGGFSHLFARPAYQDGVPGTGAMRGVPDVSADAGFSSGMAIVISDSTQYLIGEPGDLPDRGKPRLPGRLPRRDFRQQHGQGPAGDDHRIPRDPRLGPCHRLGQPQRPGPRAAAG